MMRIAAACGMFVLGVLALGFWAAKVTTILIERDLRQRAEALLQGSSQPLDLVVSGRDISLSGALEGEAERAYLLAQMGQLAGLRQLRADVTLLPLAAPYRLRFEKTAPPAALVVEGHLPKAELLHELGLAGQKITLARGAPTDWSLRAKAVMSAVSLLDQAVAELEGQDIRLEGEHSRPEQERMARALLAEFPEADLRLTWADDGRPPLWWLRFDAETGAEIGGKLPQGVKSAEIAALLGLGDLRGEPREAQAGAADLRGLAALAPWLGQIEHLRLQWSPTAARALVEVQGDIDETILAAAFQVAGFTPDIRQIIPQGAALAQRRNAATGQQQVLLGEYWLEVPQILRTPQGCQKAVDSAWRGRSFRAEQAQADIALVNDLARHMHPCAALPAFRAEILYPRETDAARAEALRQALYARGLRPDALSIRAYGAAGVSADIRSAQSLIAGTDLSILWAN